MVGFQFRKNHIDPIFFYYFLISKIIKLCKCHKGQLSVDSYGWLEGELVYDPGSKGKEGNWVPYLPAQQKKPIQT